MLYVRAHVRTGERREQPSVKRRFINILAIFASLAFFYILYTRRSEVVSIFEATEGAVYRWLVVAVVCQLLGYFFQTRAHQQSLLAAGIRRKLRAVLPLVLAALVINTTAPTGGASGALLFADDAENHGESGLAATSGLILLLICSYLGILAILSFAFVYLRATGHLGPVEVICYLILLAMAVAFIGLLVASRSDSEGPARFLGVVNRTWFRIRRMFSKKAEMSELWVANVTCEMKAASSSISHKPYKVLDAFAMELLVNFFNLATLFFIFLAFGQITETKILVAGYAIGELFKIVSPAPEGVGVTEVSMVVVYTSFGMDPFTATAVSLIYRGLNFWIPMGLGFLVLQARHLRPRDFKKGPDFSGS